jgi:hypothetical protein
MFTQQLVRRNDKIWRNDTALFKVIAVQSNVALVQRLGTAEVQHGASSSAS